MLGIIIGDAYAYAVFNFWMITGDVYAYAAFYYWIINGVIVPRVNTLCFPDNCVQYSTCKK